MRKRPMSTISGEAAGNKEPTTTQQTSTAQKARISVRRVWGARRNRGVDLSCCRSMLSINCRLFRLGDIGLGPCREQNQGAGQAEAPAPPFPALDPGLPKDAHQQAAGDSKPSAR